MRERREVGRTEPLAQMKHLEKEYRAMLRTNVGSTTIYPQPTRLREDVGAAERIEGAVGSSPRGNQSALEGSSEGLNSSDGEGGRA